MSDSAHQYNQDDPVVAQYEKWTYPAPVDDLNDPSISQYVRSFLTLKHLAVLYWPAGQPREDLDILVAGCGTMAAACYALLYPKCRVVGIDISRTSLAHHERLKARHNLANLTVRHCPLEQVGSLGQSFDYVSCHGVLHHLPDPPAGLRALSGVLRPHGVAALMVYARYGRAHVYVFQDLFKLLGLHQTAEDLGVVRETLAALPNDHPLRLYLRRATDLNTDAGMVDTFLHRRDRSYSVADCLELVNQAGMVFQGWDRNFYYHPDGLFANQPNVLRRFASLSREEVWQAMELAFDMIGMHWFYVCRSDRDPASYVIPWELAKLLECVPVRGGQLAQGAGADGKPQWAIARPNFPPLAVSARDAAIFSQIDGRRTVGQCLAAAQIPGDNAAQLAAAREFFGLLWRTGLGILRLPPHS